MGKFILSFKRKGTVTPSGSDLVELGILPKQISEFTNADIGTEVSIPYTDSTGKILLSGGCIEFEVVGVNHHINSEHQQTITLMTKNIIRYAAFDAKEPNNQLFDEFIGGYGRASSGNNCWKYSNIRQWLNSSGEAGKWFTPQHEYDDPPISDNIENNEENASYKNDPGFLAGFSSEVLQHFTDITNITAIPTLDGGGSEETVDKVFLPSYTEMFGLNNCEGDNEDGIAEGTALPKFTDNSSRIKYPAEGKYWMRSPAINNSCSLRYVDSGSYDEYDFYSAWGADLGPAPIIVLH